MSNQPLDLEAVKADFDVIDEASSRIKVGDKVSMDEPALGDAMTSVVLVAPALIAEVERLREERDAFVNIVSSAGYLSDDGELRNAWHEYVDWFDNVTPDEANVIFTTLKTQEAE